MSARLLKDWRAQVKIKSRLTWASSYSQVRRQQTLNETGCAAVGKYLDHRRLRDRHLAGDVMQTRWTAESLQTPYEVERHRLYQRSGGGRTCPIACLERSQVIMTSTPLFCQTNCLKKKKHSLWFRREMCSETWSENHSRSVAVSYIQRVSEAICSIIEAKEATSTQTGGWDWSPLATRWTMYCCVMESNSPAPSVFMREHNTFIIAPFRWVEVIKQLSQDLPIVHLLNLPSVIPLNRQISIMHLVIWCDAIYPKT